MNQTININLAGMIFHVDENAYQLLTSYLEKLKKIFEAEEGGNEIIHDVESRFAELFQQKLGDKEVVTLPLVEEVISIMGEPEDYAQNDEEEFYSQKETYTHFTKNKPRRLYRNPDDKIIGGVASGLAAYFGIDPVWVRLVLASMFFLYGIGFIPYIILYIVIPEAKTTAEKLEMKGEPINLSNIEKSVKDELNNMKEKVTDSSLTGKVKSLIEKIIDVIIQIVQGVFKFAGKLIGVALFIVGIAVLFSFISFVFGGTVFIGGVDYTYSQWGGFFDMIWISSSMHYWVLFGLFLVAMFPVIIFIMLATRILFNWKDQSKWIYISGVLMLLVGIGILGINGIKIANQFQANSKFTSVIPVDSNSKTIYTYLEKSDINYDLDNNPFLIENDILYSDDVEFTVYQTDKEVPYIEITGKAYGENRLLARNRAKGLDYKVSQKDSLLKFDGFFSFPVDQKLRNQEVKVKLFLPVGYNVYLDESMIEIIYNIQNITDTYDGDMVDYTWSMTEDGLICSDCPLSKKYHNLNSNSDYDKSEDSFDERWENQ